MSSEMELPSYSVLIPTIGRNSLFSAVDSVVKQTFPPLEILILAHEGSLDFETQNVLISVDTVRIKWVPKGNAASTRNAGILEAQGLYIAFLDDDDEWVPKKMEIQLSKSRSSIISCRADYVGWSNGIKPKNLFSKNFLLSVYPNWVPTGRKTIIPTSSLVIKTELAKKILFDELLSEREELWLIHQVESEGHQITQIDDVLVTFKSRKPLDVRKVSLRSDLHWFNKLESVQRGLGWNFLLGVAIRNRLLSVDFFGSFRLLLLAIFEPFR
jgi:glycosyltransferase involved in cell wall biosynthesis